MSERIYPPEAHGEIEEYAQVRKRRLTDDEILALGFGLGQGIRAAARANVSPAGLVRIFAELKKELLKEGILHNGSEVDGQLNDVENCVERALKTIL